MTWRQPPSMRLQVLLAAILITSLSACSTLDIILPREQRTAAPPPTTKSANPSSSPAPVRSGGYYLDDGPGDNPPADMLSIPDAVPKLEPYIARANKPYIALGATYTPMTHFEPYKKQGMASWYGRRYHGQKTSIGEIYDMYGMTGAHTTLPLPSYVRVSNPENHQSVIVRINDRGPFHEGRLIDLSYVAAYKLGIAQKGSGWVEVEAIDVKQYLAQQAKQAPAQTQATNKPAPASAKASESVETDSKPLQSGHYLQLGAFRLPENAQNLAQKLQQQAIVPSPSSISVMQQQGLYRVWVGPFDSALSADKIADKIKTSLGVAVIAVSF